MAYGVSCLSVDNQPIDITFNTTSTTMDNVTFQVTSSCALGNFCINILVNTEPDIEIGSINPPASPTFVSFQQNHTLPRMFFFPMSSSWNWDSTACVNSTGLLFDGVNCNVGAGSMTYIVVDEVYYASKFGGQLMVMGPFVGLNFPYFSSD